MVEEKQEEAINFRNVNLKKNLYKNPTFFVGFFFI